MPGTSVVHRLHPGLKVAALALLGTLLFLLPRVELALAVLVVVLCLYRLAGIAQRDAWRQLRPMLWVVVLFCLVQWWLAGWLAAALVVVRLLALLLLASLVTLTTRASDMID